jgi:uncharacterized protein YndB with AHSA1/START domain
MAKLFVDKVVGIKAPASKVWGTLTLRENTDQWAHEFSSGGPRFHLESDWQLGSPVLWKGEDGTVIVRGNVTALEQDALLRFTVFDVRSAEDPPVTAEDGITFALSEKRGQTRLQLRHGDFSVYREGKTYHELSAQIWDRVLKKVKQLAEHNVA